MGTTQTIKKQVEESLQKSIVQLIQSGCKFCLIEDLEYTVNENKYDVELYSEYKSNSYMDKIACKYLKNNNMLIKNNYNIPTVHANKTIVQLITNDK